MPNVEQALTLRQSMPDALKWISAYPCISVQSEYQDSVYPCWCN